MSGGAAKREKYFYANAKNLCIGEERLVKGRAHGVVKAILTTDWRFHIEAGFSAHVDKILRVCFVFNDAKPGKLLLPPDGLTYVECPGYGTYLPRGSGDDVEWQTF